jgi:hypothetical protein
VSKDAVAQFAPVGVEIKDFAASLREWPVAMQLKTLTGEAWEKRVKINFHFGKF